MKYRVTAPEKGYEGEVAGARFIDGVAEVDDSNTAALNYFSRRGYTVEAQEKKPAARKAAGSDKEE